MSTLWFVVPAHGRLDMSAVCLRQLKRTCDELDTLGIRASAVVVADDDNLDIARGLGFGTVERNNTYLGRRFNDGYELACRAGVDYCVPLGTDDWVDATWIAAHLPGPTTIRCSRLMAMVAEDGSRMSILSIPYRGGHGIRIIPRHLLEQCNGRPAGEDRRRAIDTSTLEGLERRNPTVTLTYVEAHPHQLVDWKSPGAQLNGYDMCAGYRLGDESHTVLRDLAGRYPADALTDMSLLFASRLEVAA